MASKLMLQGSLVRLVYGVLTLVAPKVLEPFGSDRRMHDDGRYFVRLFAGRDIALGLATIAARDKPQARALIGLNLASDAADLVSAKLEARDRGGIDRPLVIGLGFAVAGMASWFRASRA